jgi:hypothetical protein
MKNSDEFNARPRSENETWILVTAGSRFALHLFASHPYPPNP